MSIAAPHRSHARRLRRVRVLRSNAGRVGAVLLVAALVVALFGSFFAPYSPTATLGVPGAAPGGGHTLGLDFIGRDVLSRTLYGGRSTLLLAGLATVLTYAIGCAIGLVAGISRSAVDPVLMRGVDILLSVPALLVILLLVTAFGINRPVLVIATSLVLLPGVARIVRSATLEVSTRGFVESAIARGEPTHSLLRREVLPNISGIVMADLGLRFSWAIILIASVNVLGIGIQPPTPDWGVMVSENRVVLGSNPMSVIAPSVMLAVLIVGVNLVGDAYVRSRDRSSEDA
jgi:ABC-type dipeptide/oligopeptide/nickel transport system permease subunit